MANDLGQSHLSCPNLLWETLVKLLENEFLHIVDIGKRFKPNEKSFLSPAPCFCRGPFIMDTT